MLSFQLVIFISVLFDPLAAVEVVIPELGKVSGVTGSTAWTNRTIFKFFSINYGQSPSGDRRFAPPIPVEPWEGTYDASTYRKICPQHETMIKYSEQITDGIDLEDCLALNLFTPKIPKNDDCTELLPVMVYIHGGAFRWGTVEDFPPDYLLEHDIILVVPQYRLNVFGFMALETEGMPGNVGLLDQLLAFEWVNKYIRHFGGDNTRVTLFGQSAGAASISLHLMSPMVQDHLFQRVILQSGSAFAEWPFDDDVKTTTTFIYRALANDNSSKIDEDVMEKEMKRASVLDLLKATENAAKLYPSIDKKISRVIVQKKTSIKFLTDYPWNLAEKGHYRSLPILLGVTKHDGSFFLSDIYDSLERRGLQDDDYLLRNKLSSFYQPVLENKDVSGVFSNLINDVYLKKLYDLERNLTFKDIAPALTDIFGTFFLKGAVLKNAASNAKKEPETYLYSLHHKGEHTRFGFGKDTSRYPYEGGVHHSDDLLYLFPFPYKTDLNEEDTKMAKLMVDIWANFAINGKPTSSLLSLEWPQLKSGTNGPYLILKPSPYIEKDFVDIEFKAASREAGTLN